MVSLAWFQVLESVISSAAEQDRGLHGPSRTKVPRSRLEAIRDGEL